MPSENEINELNADADISLFANWANVEEKNKKKAQFKDNSNDKMYFWSLMS